MYARLLRLPADDQAALLLGLRRLRGRAAPSSSSAARELRAELKQLLKVPLDADLPEYMRRRFVEVARLLGVSGSFDEHSDADLAQTIIEAVLKLTAKLKPGNEDYGAYFRTLDSDQRGQRRETVTALEEVLGHSSPSAGIPASTAAYAEDAELLRSALAKLAIDELTVDIASSEIAPPAADLLAASAAALFLGGIALDGPRHKDRRKRARFSTRVQAVVILAVWITAQRDLERLAVQSSAA